MKILDKYILKTFFRPFIATFLIVLFVLVMQILWQTFENIAGKGISLPFILKFLYYTTLIITPQAIPIAVLLSSIMALGSMGENYEFAAAKSAGVSLPRLVRPLVILALLLSVVNFYFLNNIYPYAKLKSQNLYANIKKKKPALALVPGSFNNDIPGYQIKFDEKYGEEENLLKKVLIYDVSKKNGNQKVITSERGEISSDEGSRYLTFTLYDGFYYEELAKNARTSKKRKRMAASSATFDEYEFNIDISELSNSNLDSVRVTNNYTMLTVIQLSDTIPDIKAKYDETLTLRAKKLLNSVSIQDLDVEKDSVLTKNISPNIIDNFNLNNKIALLNSSFTKINRLTSSTKNSLKSVKYNRKKLNLFDTEYYNRISFSLSCLILFFIGAPLGSIIRKGGFGLPMILAIAIYVVYFFSNTFGKNLAEESSISAFLGSWVAVIIMAPIGFLLTRSATKDKGIFNTDAIVQPVNKFFKKIFAKKQ
jgi:lipopolysaccharide export system permease protein